MFFRGDSSMSKPSALTLFCCLATLPLIGCANGVGPQSQAYPTAAPEAAAPGGERIYAAGPGGPAAILVMLPGPGDMMTANPQLWASQGFDVVTPTPSEIYRIAADQQAAAARLIAEAQQMATAPVWLVGPNPEIEAAMASLPGGGPGQVSGVVVTSTSSGTGTCSERMIYSYSGNGAAPKVSVSKSGNACPPGSPFGGLVGSGNAVVAPPAPAFGRPAPRILETSAPPARSPAPRVIEAAVPAQSTSPVAQRAAVQQIADLIKSAPPG
jgi:hypothetical protein